MDTKESSLDKERGITQACSEQNYKWFSTPWLGSTGEKKESDKVSKVRRVKL